MQRTPRRFSPTVAAAGRRRCRSPAVCITQNHPPAAADITLTPADLQTFAPYLPIHGGNRTLVLLGAAHGGWRQTVVDWGGGVAVLHFPAGHSFYTYNLELRGRAPAAAGLSAGLPVQVAGSSLWPTLTGDANHTVRGVQGRACTAKQQYQPPCPFAIPSERGMPCRACAALLTPCGRVATGFTSARWRGVLRPLGVLIHTCKRFTLACAQVSYWNTTLVRVGPECNINRSEFVLRTWNHLAGRAAPGRCHGGGAPCTVGVLHGGMRQAPLGCCHHCWPEAAWSLHPSVHLSPPAARCTSTSACWTWPAACGTSTHKASCTAVSSRVSASAVAAAPLSAAGFATAAHLRSSCKRQLQLTAFLAPQTSSPPTCC